MTDLDPAAIKAEHIVAPRGLYNCGACLSHWPCLPYRLAAALVEAQEREQRVRAVWDNWRGHMPALPWRLRNDMDAALDGKP